jgi:hypothetical protein
VRSQMITLIACASFSATLLLPALFLAHAERSSKDGSSLMDLLIQLPE